MTVPSGKIWKVYTAGTLFFLPVPERQTTTKITHKHRRKVVDRAIKRGVDSKDIGRHFAMDYIKLKTRNSPRVFAWTVSRTGLVLLIVVAFGGCCRGSSEDKGCIEAREEG